MFNPLKALKNSVAIRPSEGEIPIYGTFKYWANYSIKERVFMLATDVFLVGLPLMLLGFAIATLV